MSKSMNWITAGVGAVLLFASGTHASVTLHPLFCDNAVLQRGVDIPVFGTADDGEEVSVTLGGMTLSTKADDGRWKVQFEPMKAGGPYMMVVKGKNTLRVKNILVGDVWICTGQSNMATGLGIYVKKYPEIMEGHPAPVSDENIRLIKVNLRATDTPQEVPVLAPDFETWKACGPESALLFSATGYFFGKNLQPHVKVPIGLIQTCVGGTPAEAWTPHDVLEGNPAYADILDTWQEAFDSYPEKFEKYQPQLAAWKKKNLPEGQRIMDLPVSVRRKMPKPPKGPTSWRRPSGLYNAMIAPLHAYPIKGAIWYQGEANAHSYERSIQYRSLLPDMIQSWRQRWGIGNFPFFWVQLAPYMRISETPQDRPWAWMRESMDLIQKEVPAGGMACIIDGGMQTDIHPPYKEFAGSRLALLSRARVYGQDVVASGPTLSELTLAGAKAALTFDNTGSGLVKKALTLDGGQVTVSGEKLVGFTICGEDRHFVNAQATITGKNTVAVWSDDVSKPTAVRYAWANFPLANLYNSEGLPATPFRTDDFPPPGTLK